MYNLDDIISRIKSEKSKKKYTNAELSGLSEIPIGTLNKILGNETKDPQLSNIIRIASALDVSADYLIYGDEEKKENDEYIKKYEKLDNISRNAINNAINFEYKQTQKRADDFKLTEEEKEYIRKLRALNDEDREEALERLNDQYELRDCDEDGDEDELDKEAN